MDDASRKILERLCPDPSCPTCGCRPCYYTSEGSVWCTRRYLKKATGWTGNANASVKDLVVDWLKREEEKW